jgi:RNA polymerase sigma factor (sigma-70 family)
MDQELGVLALEAGRMQPAADPQARVAQVVGRHQRTLLRVARAASLCHDDALDAYQRALEIYVRRLASVDPATELAWLRVVVRHEALAIRRARSESVAGEEMDLDAFVPSGERSVEDVAASSERVRRSAEALRALKPDEAQALMLKAHGLSYDEIGERNGWSYTKVNRAITEGRRRFMRVYEGIEAGESCERFAPIVEALAAGSATSAQVLEIRPHLRHCTACRATVRDLHLSRLRRAGLFWPWLGLFARPDRTAQPPDHAARPGDVVHPEELIRPDTIVPPREELVETLGRLATLKREIASFFHRANASDLATGVHIATSSGGGRITGVAALLGLCISSVGAGTVCVVTGILPDPTGIVRESREKPRPRVKRDRTPPPSTPALAVERPIVRIVPTPTPTPTAAPTPRPSASSRPRRERRPPPRRDPAQGTQPDSHENPPISPPPADAAAAGNQETFTPEAASGSGPPAPAPATGGGEFIP